MENKVYLLLATLFFSAHFQAHASSCEIIGSEQASRKISGLTTYWAQEYTGNDLLRQQMKAMPVDALQSIVGVWDTDFIIHGEHVAHLIASEDNSALIPLRPGEILKYQDLDLHGEYLEKHQQVIESCLRKNNCPHYINNSMGWREIPEIAELFIRLHHETGSFLIKSAGNSRRYTEPQEARAAHKGAAIIITNVDGYGIADESTSFYPLAVISAPASAYMTSYNDRRELSTFGGTSGSAPLVTAALTYFTLKTGYFLTSEQASQLLINTALPYANVPSPSLLGHGILNSYKLAQVAERLLELCPFINRDQCISDLLDSSPQKLYHFESDVQKATYFKEVLLHNNYHTNYSCEDKRRIFKNLRQEALTTRSPDLMYYISEVYQREGFSLNASFYRSMSFRLREGADQLTARMLSDYPDGSQYLFVD